MHYNKSTTHSNYYNAYKAEMSSIEKKSPFSSYKIAKIGVSVLTFTMIGILYFNKYIPTPTLSSIMTIENEEPPKIVFSENIQPQNIQLQNSTSQTLAQIKLNATDTEATDSSTIERTQISKKDISLIIQIIMSQMQTKEGVNLTQQIQKAEQYKTTIPLKENNHYNKIVLSETQFNSNTLDNQQELRNKINTLIDKTPIAVSSNYEGSLQQEITIRSNEMRVIVVKKGDTLSKIAKRAYGDIYAYPKIFSANPEVLKNPNEIFVGQKLRIPS
jgi:nucleoid-associated protein YgaU